MGWKASEEPAGAMIPLARPDISEREISAVVDVLRTPHLSFGPELARFEQALARFTGTEHAVAVSSGTAGLHLCIKALGLGPGDEVITTPFSFVSSANALLFEGVRPVFADIDPDSLNLDPERVAAAVGPRTRAILAVHIFGNPAAMGDLLTIARRHGLLLIEDACEALGATVAGAAAGSLGDAGVFGFYPNKQITTGEGGAVITRSRELADKLRLLRNQGRDAGEDWLDMVALGCNYRLSDLQCALGRVQLERLPDMLARRWAVARRYDARLAGHPDLRLPPRPADAAEMSWFVYVLRLAERFDRGARDRVVRLMAEQGVACGRYFAPIHLQPYYRRRFGYAPGDFPETEAAADRALALPFFGHLDEPTMERVCRALETALTAPPA